MSPQRIYEQPLYPYQRNRDQDRKSPNRHPVVIVGAGPVGLTAAIDLALQGIHCVVVDDNDSVSWGSRAICFAKRSLEIMERLGCGERLLQKGVTWNLGKVLFDQRLIYQFNLLPEAHHKYPAFINIQQYWVECYLVERCQELSEWIELRGRNQVQRLEQFNDHVLLRLKTPDGEYTLEADWVIACDGANSTVRDQLKQDFVGRIFEDNFLIADVVMDAEFPTERRFWFNPPFNRGQSALLHKQPDNVWRIDLQLGWEIDKEQEKQPERVIPRLQAMLGDEINFELEWVSIYTFRCCRMEKFRHGRILFAGDSAHQVSPFGARGANSGMQDVDNLCWKLKLVLDQQAPESLLDSYDNERIQAAEENIQHSSRSTDFITPKSEISRIFRDAVLNLAEHQPFARPLVNSGRLSQPCSYLNSPINTDDVDDDLPSGVCPGSPLRDAPTGDGWLCEQVGGSFQLLCFDQADKEIHSETRKVEHLSLNTKKDSSGELAKRYLGKQKEGYYLIRPDQHIAARWTKYDPAMIHQALQRASRQTEGVQWRN